jgi:hypothetical protein
VNWSYYYYFVRIAHLKAYHKTRGDVKFGVPWQCCTVEVTQTNAGGLRRPPTASEDVVVEDDNELKRNKTRAGEKITLACEQKPKSAQIETTEKNLNVHSGLGNQSLT